MVRHVAFAILALAVLAGGLAGCRSMRRSAPQAAPPVAQMPATQAPTYYPSYPSTSAPAVTYPPSSYPSFPSSGMANTGTTRVVRTMPNTPSDLGGSPDGGGAAFPEPAVPDAVPGGAVPAYAGAINSGAELDTAIAQLQSDIQRIRQEVASAGPDANPPAGRAGGDEARATAFADQLRRSVKGEVVQNGSVVIVRMSDAFQPGSEKLKKDAGLTATLLATAQALTSAGARDVKVVGHSDSDKITVSKWPSNKALSEARAQTVAQELSRHGVPASRIEVSGRGFSEPLVPNERSAGDKARNRRVEIHVGF